MLLVFTVMVMSRDVSLALESLNSPCGRVVISRMYQSTGLVSVALLDQVMLSLLSLVTVLLIIIG